MPALQGRLQRSVLVTAAAFAHHTWQEETLSDGLAKAADGWSTTGNALAEQENIVAETAERIFADLADAQTVNRDHKGGWKAPLWHALSEAGLPLSWVPEDCGGSGASLAAGRGRLANNPRHPTDRQAKCAHSQFAAVQRCGLAG